MEERSNYIDWVLNLDAILKKFNIECSDYDEFHIVEAIEETERIIQQYEITNEHIFTEDMIDDYMRSAIKNDPSKRDYYETISFYVKKRLLHN